MVTIGDLKTRGLALRMAHFALTAFIKFRGPQALRDTHEKPGQLANQTVTDPATFGCSSIDCGGTAIMAVLS